ncbi:PAS domain-containing protein [Bradyrhizobium manausense]|uniref:PAS domain-containing protein n=1 Tax=Bradyrhizobium manausense TaxID=989370 RepID=UPI001BAAAC6C|nr:PAS domain-containing protein [Bradyrhizobium manausense]MBR0687761.1 PAS domain-containing protein [Bradyrhizobium manausense]
MNVFGLHAKPLQHKRFSSYHFLRLVEENGDVGFWSCEFATDEITSSVGLHRILGTSPSFPLSYQRLVGLMHPTDRPHHKHMDQVVRAGQPFVREFRIVRPDQTVRWILIKAEAILDREGKPVRAIGLVLDVTARREALHAVMQSESRFDAILAALGAIVWTTAADGRAQPSRSWQDLTGQSAVETEGEGWLDAVHPDDREHTRSAFRGAVANKTICSADYRVRTPDDGYIWLHARGAPVWGPDGTLLHWIGICLKRSEYRPGGFAHEHSVIATDMILTAAQVRGARGILTWSVQELASRAGVSVSTIRRLEANESSVVRRNSKFAVRTTLEEAGIEFGLSPDGRPSLFVR